MLLNVNTYAISVIESSFALTKFMEVLMNVYLPYSFNCWRKWMYILRKWTAKGVHVTGAKRGKTRAAKTRLVLVWIPIGWESGASFVNQSIENRSKRCKYHIY